MKTDLSKYDNSWYQPGRSALIRGIWYFVNALFFINPLFPFSGFKVFLLKVFGAQLGQGVVIKPAVNIKYPWKLTIGNWVWIGEKVWIDNLDQVFIGDHVCISQGAMLLTGNHNYKKSTFDLLVGEIVLKEGTWIGTQAIVGPGVICQSHSVLVANSVAGGHLEAYTIYRGNPAIAIRKRIIE